MHDLSGGQQQRVAIAGALAASPEVLVLDEATSMLDDEGKSEVIQVVEGLRGHGTVVAVTHDMELAARCDRLLVMRSGRLVACGAPAEVLADAGLLAGHAVVTIEEAVIGLVLGVAVGFAVAVLMDRFELVWRALDPLITISQTIPTVAIAPLLVLWFGYDLLPKVLLVVLTTFFPITVALASGFRSVDPDVVDLMRTMNASRAQIFWYAKLPAAADQFFAGLRISATYAVVGAVVAEWLGGFSGLGVYMTRVRKSYSYDKMFAVILLISALSLLLMGLVSLLQRVCMPWEQAEKRKQG